MSLNFDNNIIYRVQQANDIAEVISEHIRLDKKGKEFVGLCPFHEDHKPSMFVNPVKGIYKCFACGAGGDVIKFVQMRENLTFPQALERLANRAGIKIEKKHGFSKKQDTQVSDIDPKVLADINLWAAKFFRANLEDETKGASARDYLVSRSISQESIKKWGLGLAVESWDQLLNAARKKDFAESDLLKAGLIVSRDNSSGCYDKFRNRLMFPIIDATSRVIGFGGRTLGDDPAKYMNSPATVLFDKSNCVYGLNSARHEIVKSSTAIVVEGYTDVIMAHQNNCCNVIATLGTSLTTGHVKLLRRFAKSIVLIFDSDVAGSAAADRGLDLCLSQKADIKLASVPQGKDPCDFVLENGEDAFKEIVVAAVDVMEYKWSRLKETLDRSDTITDAKSAVQSFIETIAAGLKGGNIDPLASNLIIARLAKLTGIDNTALKQQLRQRASTAQRQQGFVQENSRVVSRDTGNGFFAKAQQELLEVLICEPGQFEKIQKKISPEMFDVPILKLIAEKLFEVIAENNENVFQKTLALLESTDESQLFTDLEAKGSEKENCDQRIAAVAKAFDEHNAGKQNVKIEAIDDETEKLRQLQNNLQKKNLRKTGLIPD